MVISMLENNEGSYEWSEVDRFASEMKKVLDKNKEKGKTWKNMKGTRFLESKLIEEVVEFFKSDPRNDLGDLLCRLTHEGQRQHDQGEPKKELVDIANISMMLWDNEHQEDK